MKRTALIALLALAVFVPSASAVTCGNFCRDRLVVKPGEVTRWESHQTFGSYRGDAAINLLAYVHGRYLHSDWYGCRGYYYRGPVVMQVRTCGDPTTIRIRAMTFGGTQRILLRYRGETG